MNYLNQQGIIEAMTAAIRALSALSQMECFLDSVMKWSKRDSFSGGMCSTRKHCNARLYITETRRALGALNGKLKNIRLSKHRHIQVNYDELKSFFSLFYADKLFVAPTQSEIKRAQKDVRKVKCRVKNILYRLSAML